jgi:hypothetical protein
VKPELDFRAGIIVPPIGRFNTFHDSNLNILTLRPLINQYIVPTAYRDAGVGVRGVFRLPHEMKLSYEADVVNGFQAANDDGEATPFSRIYGQSSAAEPVSIAFQATRNSKAVAGRIGFSPILGLVFRPTPERLQIRMNPGNRRRLCSLTRRTSTGRLS